MLLFWTLCEQPVNGYPQTMSTGKDVPEPQIKSGLQRSIRSYGLRPDNVYIARTEDSTTDPQSGTVHFGPRVKPSGPNKPLWRPSALLLALKGLWA